MTCDLAARSGVPEVRRLLGENEGKGNGTTG